ncbi:MAG TPA: hypothetical protein VJ570_14445 [Holophagaceae bacterium]|nr:hypothetical protein [Holophagaceae bacterium]
MPAVRSLALLLLAATAPSAQPALTRRPLQAPTRTGWARVTLDAEAQRRRKGLWISDAEGRPVPFQEMQEGTRTQNPGPIPGLRLGRDAGGRPSAAFELPPFPGGTPDLRLEVEAQDRPWIARVKFERQGPGGTWLLWDPRPRPHVWQFAGTEERLRVPLPAEPGPWRLTLIPVVGRAPRWTGLAFESTQGRWNLAREERVSARLQAEGSGRWRLSLPGGEDVRALDVKLRPPVGALQAELAVPQPPEEGRPREPRPLAHRGALWALPAFESEGTRLDLLEPFEGGDLLLTLPQGAEPLAVEALCARATLAFPAERGRAYFVHLGGTAKEAPGSLADLAHGFDPQQAEALTLGPTETDPHGYAVEASPITGWERVKGAWPWAVGALTVLLLALGLRLMKPSVPPQD